MGLTYTRDEEALAHAITMERLATRRIRRAAALLAKWDAKRARLERKLGAEAVARVVNSEAAIKVITQKRSAVRATVKRLGVE